MVVDKEDHLNITDQLIAIVLESILIFLCNRSFLWAMKGYLLNKSARRKIRKVETFKEWLLYTRFRGIIPKIWLVLYFISEIIHLCGILSCFVLDQLQVPLIGEKILINLVRLDGISWLVIQILFWSSKPGWAFHRWIEKKHRQKKG